MVVLVLLVLALFVLQTLLPNRFREPAPPGTPGKLSEALGNRDHMRPLTVTGERATRALANLHEALPVFLGLALMGMIVAPEAAQAKTGALVFLVARVLYVAAYLAGVIGIRTLIWIASVVGLVMMLIPILTRT